MYCVLREMIIYIISVALDKNASSSFFFSIPSIISQEFISRASERNEETDLKVSDANAHPQKCHPFPLHPQICVRETNCTSCNTAQIHGKCNCCIPSLELWTHTHSRVPVFERWCSSVDVRVFSWFSYK